MSARRRIAFAVAAGTGSRILGGGTSLVLIPILFTYLGQVELGVWFLLAGSAALLGLLDMGLSPTLTRHIAFAKGKSGSHHGVSLTSESLSEIRDLVATGQRVYRYMSVVAFAVTTATGLWFLGKLDISPDLLRDAWIAWVIMCAGHALGVWAGFVSSVLIGLGDVGWDETLNFAVIVVKFVASVLVVVLGGGLIGLAVVACLSGLARRYTMLYLLRRRHAPLFSAPGRWKGPVFRAMVRPALQEWVIALGVFLVLYTGQYFIGYLRSAGEVPAYVAAYALVSTIHAFAKSPVAASTPFISQAWQAGNLAKVQSILLRNMRLGIVVMLAGAGALLACGREVCELWLGAGNFIGYPVLGVFLLTLVLDCQHAIAIAAGIATGDIPYGPWVFGAGVLTVVLTSLLIGPLGLLGVALSTCLAYGLTVNWYAVYRPLRRLRLSIRAYAREILLPLAVIGAAFVGCCQLVARAVDSPVGRILAVSAVAAVLMCAVLYWWSFSPDDRAALRRAVVRIRAWGPAKEMDSQ